MTRNCECEGCERPALKGSLCAAHAKRRSLHGASFDRSPITRPQRGEMLAWLKRAASTQANECIEWPYGKLTSGYGSLLLNGRRTTAHRYVCRLVHGAPKDEALEAAHSCGNRACCNPAHLRWATRVENAKDKLTHGTHGRGENNFGATITEEMAIAIFEAAKTASPTVVAARFGVTKSVVSSIKGGCSWAWLTGAMQPPSIADGVPPRRMRVTLRRAA